MAERQKSTFQRLQDGGLNRKQRKELAQRLAKDDPGLEIVHRDAGRTIQQMQKALTKMNVHLANAINDVSGVTGWRIIRAIVSGQRDPRPLARLRDVRVRASEEEIACSLEGNWQSDVLFELKQALETYDFHQKQLADCDAQLQRYMAALPDRAGVPVAEPAAEPKAPVGKRRKAKSKRKAKNYPSFDLAVELARKTGVDLTTIDGINVLTAQTIFAELGADLSAFPSEAHFCSWLTLSPKREVSGGKVIKHVSSPMQNRVALALRMAAQSLFNSNSYLGAKSRQLRARLGGLKAIKAMARCLACLVYRLLTKGQAWVDRGAAHFEEQRKFRDMAGLKRRAAAMGLRLAPNAWPSDIRAL